MSEWMDVRVVSYRAEASRAGERWCASVDSEYRAAFELARQIGWGFEE